MPPDTAISTVTSASPTGTISPQPLTPAMLLRRLSAMELDADAAAGCTSADSSILDTGAGYFDIRNTSLASTSSSDGDGRSDRHRRVLVMDEEDEAVDTDDASCMLLAIPPYSPCEASDASAMSSDSENTRTQATVVLVRSPRDVASDVALHLIHTLTRALDLIRIDLRRTLKQSSSLASSLTTSISAMVPTRVVNLIHIHVLNDLYRQIDNTRSLLVEGVARDVARVFDANGGGFLSEDIDDVEMQWDRFQVWVEEYVAEQVALVLDTIRLYCTETIPQRVSSTLATAGDYSAYYLKPVVDAVMLGIMPWVGELVKAVAARGERVSKAVRRQVRREVRTWRRTFGAAPV